MLIASTEPTERTATSATDFLPHVQGLRAIAVLAVVAFHLWPQSLPGGFAGVDVFFVISGFLITGHLARELSATGRIRMAAFWARRARRLLPAALVVLCFCAIVVSTPFLSLVSALPLRVKEILASAFYVANWHLVATSANYFGDSSNPTFARHYWSLSVEEQFYLVWPPLIMVGVLISRRVLRKDRIGVVSAVALVSLASFVASVCITAESPTMAYFVTFLRVWEFGAGALLALVPAIAPGRIWSRHVCALLGLSGLVASFFFMNAAVPFPGYAALLPVMATVLVIAAGPNRARWSLTGVISRSPFSFVGRISYSLYLWHWPLILVAPALPWWTGDNAQLLMVLLLAVLLAWLTRRFIEEPVLSWRVLRDARPRSTFAVSAGAMALVALLTIGLAGVNLPRYTEGIATISHLRETPDSCFGAAQRFDDACARVVHEGYAPAATIAGKDAPSKSECLGQFGDDHLVTCSFGSSDPDVPEVLLIGDSHAYQYINAMADIAAEEGWRLTTVLKGGCPWSTVKLDPAAPFARACDLWQVNVTEWVRDHAPDVVVTSAFSGTQFATGADVEGAAQGFRQAWESVTSRGARLVAVVDNPAFPTNPNLCLLNREPGSCDAPRSEVLPSPDPLELAAAKLSEVSVVNNTAAYCSSDRCSSVVGGSNAYRDPNHLTASFASSLKPTLARAILDALHQDIALHR